MNKVSKLIERNQIFLFTLISIICALFVGGLFILISNHNPFDAYGAMLKGSLGSSYALCNTISNSVPLILTGLALAFSAKVGVFNIGAEGQLQIGALCATLVGLFLVLPPYIHCFVAIVAALAGGAIWALIAALLREKRGVNVVISTILLNYMAISLIQYLINQHLKASGLNVATKEIAHTAYLGYIIPFPYGVSTGILIALLAVIVIFILLNKSTFGYKIKAIGLNKDAAKYAGMSVGTLALLGLVISGALAGMGGGLEILGRQHKLIAGFSPGYGYSGIPISLLARNNPIGVVFSALFFSVLSTGSIEMQKIGISTSLINVIQGLVVLFIAGQFCFEYIYKKNKDKKAVETK